MRKNRQNLKCKLHRCGRKQVGRTSCHKTTLHNLEYFPNTSTVTASIKSTLSTGFYVKCIQRVGELNHTTTYTIVVTFERLKEFQIHFVKHGYLRLEVITSNNVANGA